MHRLVHKLAIFIFGLILMIGAVALFRDTLYQGQDFDVFWRAGRNFWQAQPIYDVNRDGAMVYKYPPWTVIFFAFFLGPLPLFWAKALWAVLELYCLGYVCYWLYCRRVSLTTLALGLTVFWGLWAVHFMDGQVSLPILAALLFSFNRQKLLLAAWAGSVKIFTLFPLLSLKGWNWKIYLQVVIAACILSFPIVVRNYNNHPFRMLESWRAAALSGVEKFSPDKIYGRDNQGFPALLQRLKGKNALGQELDGIIFLFCGVPLALLWTAFAKKLDPVESWSGWVALTAVVHPLAWVHFFVLAFPLSMFLLQEAKTSKHRPLFTLLSLFGISLIAGVTRNTLGKWGELLESFSIKSWGVLFCLALFIVIKKRKNKLAEIA